MVKVDFGTAQRAINDARLETCKYTYSINHTNARATYS
jgi:hypothetical protein